MKNTVNVLEYGADPTAQIDSTASFQAAINDMAQCEGTVVVPPGHYLCKTLKMLPRTQLSGFSPWSFRQNAGSVLILKDENAACLLDLTDASGAIVKGLCLEGGHLGEGICGILVHKDGYTQAGEEDVLCLEDCRIANFSGDGIRLEKIWCYRIRHCMIAFNHKNGLYADGWDGFIMDCWFSGNKESGIRGGAFFQSTLITANRIEWNGSAGILLDQTYCLNITGNSFDRCGGPGLKICARNGAENSTITITGNCFCRCGSKQSEEEPYESCQLFLEDCCNASVSGNAMTVGQDDHQQGVLSPWYGIVYRRLKNCDILGNAIAAGAVRESLLNLDCCTENSSVNKEPKHII